MPIEDPPVVFFGTFIVVVGAVFAWLASRAGTEPTTDPEEVEFQDKRLRRHVKVAGGLIICGLLIIGCELVGPRRNPASSFGMAMAALIVAGWAILMALADGMQNRVRGRKSLHDIELQKQMLEKEVERLRRNHSPST